MKFRMSVIFFVSIITAVIGLRVNGWCEEMTRGFVSKIDKHQVVISVPNSGERSFDLTKNTSVVWYKRAIPLSDLRKNTLVQLTSKHGNALKILVVEVAK